jgi:DNA-binding MarR family transcriptional regulator
MTGVRSGMTMEMEGRAASDLEVPAVSPDGPTGEPLAVQASGWLFRAAAALGGAQAEALRPLGLSPSAFNVLRALRAADDGMLEPWQLAEQLTVSRPSITGLLDTLQRKGLIDRHPHADDGRRIQVALTDAAIALLAEEEPRQDAVLARGFADVAPEEIAELISLLRRISTASGTGEQA